MKRYIVAAGLAWLAISALALPGVDQVQAEVAQGHYTQAEAMMREVVAAKPASARAHYVLAEILAHERQFDQAADQARLARTLDPALKFTKPERFEAFEQLLDRAQAGAGRRPLTGAATPPMQVAPRSGGLPGWVWAFGLLAVMALIWRLVSVRQSVVASPTYGAAPYAGMPSGAPAGGGYGPAYPAPSGTGSGLLGTGLAVAGGVAAGMFAERMLEGRQGLGSAVAPAFPDMAAGLQEGPYVDDGAQQALEDRPVDFGSGDGWDSGGAGIDDGGSTGGDGW